MTQSWNRILYDYSDLTTRPIQNGASLTCRRPSLQHPQIREPFLKAEAPGAERDAIPRADAVAVPAVRVDVQLRRRPGAEEGTVRQRRAGCGIALGRSG
jgi:hypothetical protein